MSLVRWSPFFFEPLESMDKFFDDQHPVVQSGSNSIVPPIDMYETKDAVVIETPLAGVDPSQVEIGIENGILSIKASSERKTEVDEKNYYRKEVRSGSIFRQVALPTRVKEDGAEASFENGILKITVPKAAKKEGAVKIEIKNKK